MSFALVNRAFQELWQRLKNVNGHWSTGAIVAPPEDGENVQDLCEGELWSSVEENELKKQGK